MLRIDLDTEELFDEEKEEWTYLPKFHLRLEHSLISIRKWEEKWKKPFLGRKEKTNEELLDYIRCMTIDSNVDPSIYGRLTAENIEQIVDYINDPMTATFFRSEKAEGQAPSREIVTAEIVYYWMIKLNIPLEFEKRHFSQLMTLIKVFNAKDGPKKKRNRMEAMREQRALNEARKKAANSRG